MMTQTTKGTEQTCGPQTKENRTRNLKPSGSFTTLSTIAIQTSRTQIIISVLQSGSLIHLQLVQVQPGLSEIGSNQEETLILLQDHQQLQDKLQNHESEVLSAVEKKGQEEQRTRRKQEEEEELKQVMKASLTEGWFLLLRLMKRRLQVLMLAAEFHRLAKDFADSLGRLEELQVEPEELSEVQSFYGSMRKDVLKKSLQVLTSSRVLLQKLRELQRTEATQRKGGVLQEEEEEEESSESSWSSWGSVLRLEELVETLQDRRRRSDQIIRLQLQQAEEVWKMTEESRRTGSEVRHKFQVLELQDRSPQDQNPQSGFTSADLQSKSRSDHTGSLGLDGTSQESRSASDLQAEFRTNQEPKTQSEGPRNPNLQPWSGSQQTVELRSGSEPDVKPESGSHRMFGWGFRSALKLKSASEESRNLRSRFRSEGTTETAPKTEKVPFESALEEHPRSGSEKTGDLHSDSRSAESTLDLQTHSGSQQVQSPQCGLRSELINKSGLGLQSKASSQERMDLRPRPGSNQTIKHQLIFRPAETRDFLSSFTSVLKTRPDEQPASSSTVKAGSISEESRTQQSSSRPEVCESGQNLQLVEQQMMQQLSETKAKLQIQQDQMFCKRYQDKLKKTLQDLRCVSGLLDSCTLVDLGSDPQTSRLLERFTQAEPHFRQLDSEVDYMLQSRDSLRGVQVQLEEEEELLPELLQLQQAVKNKILQSESILNLSRTFHLTANQLELLLQLEPTRTSAGSVGLCGSREAELSWYQEARQQIQNLLKTTSTLKTEICTAVTQSGSAGFRVEQLEARLSSLDSLCKSWLKEAAGQEEKQLTHLLHDDIIQLRDSFKELKKRFSNTKFNFLKRNDRTKNPKATRNQLQQVEVFQEKLQALRKRVHRVTARLGSEVKDGVLARQVEDAANELQRQMGEFERNVCEHLKSLDLTCRLQRAMEEYQFWCDEASGTIARVGKFSLQCRSTEAVAVLYRQFEKFVWPTVPQQEERISQITELAVRLHGGEEGRRYVQKMVSKHSEMVGSIRELSHGLMELEAKLKLESLKQQQNDEEKEVNKEEEREQSKENNKKENRKENEVMDNCSSQEAADTHELKETGHTPELTAKHDGEEAGAVRRRREEGQTADAGSRQSRCGSFTSSYCSTLSISCSSLETNRQIQTVHSQSQLATTEPQATPSLSVIDPFFSEIQKEFQKEMKGGEEELTSILCGSVLSPLQDASGHAELQEHEVMMEDFLSNDEYDCVSPDDISLPPLAETPESNMFQSDIEEAFCFSSHSIHISNQSQPQGELTETGTGPGVPQQTENCPSPSVILHSSTRFRPESKSVHQSPSTVPAPRLFTSTLCTILKTKRSSTNSLTPCADLSLSSPEPRPSPGSNPVHDVPKWNPSLTTVQDLSQNLHVQFFDGPDPDIKSPNTSAGETVFHRPYSNSPRVISRNNSSTEALCGSESKLQQDTKSVKSLRETTTQQDHLTLTSTGLITKLNSDFRPLFLTNNSVDTKDCTSSLTGSEPLFDPATKTEGHSQSSSPPDPVLHKDSTCPPGIDPLLPSDITLKSSANLPDMNLSQSSTGSRSGPDQVVQPFQTKSRHMSPTTTSNVTKQTVFCQSSPSDRFHLDQDAGGQTKHHINSPPQPNSVNNKMRRSLHTFCSLHESLTSTPVQQCVPSPSISFSSSAQSADPPHTHALSHPANLHVTPLSSSPHLLTPPKDPEICQPVLVCEEIRLTPQIQGPSVPPPPQAQAESLPLGTISRPGLLCFTRPLSQATVMEGSPVTLEVEVKGTPEPQLTWFTGGEESTNSPGLVPPSEDSEPSSVDSVSCFLDSVSPSVDGTTLDSVLPSLDFMVPSVDSDQSTSHPSSYWTVENSSNYCLFVETALDSYLSRVTSPDSYWSVETGPASCRTVETSPDSYWSVETGPTTCGSMESSPNSCASAETGSASCWSEVHSRFRGGDQWLGIEVFDIISEDWNTWFGTLCVLLWLIYLVLL